MLNFKILVQPKSTKIRGI